jgi:hypothetical protein
MHRCVEVERYKRESRTGSGVVAIVSVNSVGVCLLLNNRLVRTATARTSHQLSVYIPDIHNGTRNPPSTMNVSERAACPRAEYTSEAPLRYRRVSLATPD